MSLDSAYLVGPKEELMQYKFERLEVYQLGIQLLDKVYAVASLLPPSERFNLRDQLVRASTSIVLNIAEGSTGLTDAEQARFVGIAQRSLVEVVACLRIITRRKLVEDSLMAQVEVLADQVFIKIQAFRHRLLANTR
jgi:four helix bundle protein